MPTARFVRRFGRRITTPDLYRLVTAGLVVLGLGAGIVGLATVRHRSALMADIAGVSGPLSVDARNLYRALSDADATAANAFIRTIAAQPSHPIPVSTDSTLDCLVLLQQGQVDAVSTIDVLLAGLAVQDPTTQITGAAVSDEPAGVGISRQSPELVRFVNGVLERIRADGTWARSYQRWLSRLGPARPPTPVYRD